MAGPLEPLEESSIDLKTDRWIATAIGAQLDGAGYIVGEPRSGRYDASYRQAILFRVFVNVSNATPSALIEALRLLTSPDDLQYIEQYPATAMLFTDGPVISPNIHNAIQDLSPAAISDVPIMVSFSRKDPFRFGKESPPGELFVNSDADYLTGNGSDIQVQISNPTDGARLAGIAPAELNVGGFGLDVGGPELAINSPNFDTIIDSGYHLVGVYT